MAFDDPRPEIYRRLREWKELAQSARGQAPRKYEHVLAVLNGYRRLGAGARREHQRALDEAVRDMEATLGRQIGRVESFSRLS